MSQDLEVAVENEIETASPVEAASDLSVSDDQRPASGEASLATEPVAALPVTEPATPAAPAYNPNFKFNIKGKEHEIDEMFRGLVKDAESEKKVKEIFEKAYGIDAVKADRTAYKQELEGFKSQIMPHLQTLDQFTTLRDQGNLGAALKVAGISDDQIFQYAVQRLEMEKNPTLAQTYQAQQDQSLREIEMSRKLAQYEQQATVSAEQQFYNEFEESLSSVQDLASQVNSKFGTQDAPDFFRQEVMDYGLAQLQRGKQVSPAQATEYVANKYKQFFPTAPAVATPQMPQATRQPAPPVTRPATLPNPGSSNASPIKAKVRTMEDLKRAAREA